MKLIDVHSHWGTKRGYPLQTEEELAVQRQTWNSEPRYHTEAEMAQHFRDQGVQAILDLGFAKYRPLEEMQALHDYAFEVESQHRDVILGHWIHVDPARTPDGVRELHRWSPKYHTPDLKHEIPRRLKNWILFAADYPLFSYERLVRDWRAEGYAEEVLEQVFHKNAENFLKSISR